MRAKIDKETCAGCGLCVQICPAVFEMDDDKAITGEDPVSETEADNIKDAAESCPTEAILIIKD